MNLDKLFYRIILGYYYIYINNNKYKVTYPDISIKYEAEIIYDEAIEDNKFNKVYLNSDEIKLYLKIHNIWVPSDEIKFKDCEKFLEDCKVELYLNYINTKARDIHKKNIVKATKDLEVLYQKKNSFNYLTIEEHATTIKNEFILMNTIYDTNNNLIFNYSNYNNSSYYKLQSFIKEILDYSIKPDQLRLLAKSDLWKSYAMSTNMEKNILSINDDYRHLINLHKMYDNVRQHPECPSQEIIEDDDALDGWFIYQNNKAEKEKKKNAILDKFGGNMKKAGEVFMLTNDVQETKDIFDLNDQTSKHNIKEIIALGKNKDKDKNNSNESIKWQDLPFVQRDLRAQALKQSSETIKKGK
jgi:hypothetical protein